MEPRQSLSVAMQSYRPSLEDGPLKYFEKAYIFATQFYNEQIQQIWSVKFDDVTPEHFFREYIWVVHATGFNAKVVAKMMPRLVEAYGNHRECACQLFESLYIRVSQVCAHKGKAKSVHSTARYINDNYGLTWGKFKEGYLSTPQKLTKLAFIGPITCYHLARNIGLLEFVKPDLHLVRMAKYWGIKDCDEMCKMMRDHHTSQGFDPMPLGIVDLILWYAASTFGTIDIKVAGER